MSRRDWLRRALKLGERLYLAGGLQRREAVAKPKLDFALRALQDLGLLAAGPEDRLTLPAERDASDRLRALQRDLLALLPP